MHAEVGDKYETLIINGASPTHKGYPAEKKRVIILGGRNDQIRGPCLKGMFDKLIEAPLSVLDTYWSFLACQPTADTVLDQVGELPSPSAAVLIQSSRCKCGTDPLIVCPQHPCHCKICLGRTGEVRTCDWRNKATQFIADNEMEWVKTDGALTYIQALEMIGMKVPKSARERNMLNLFARLMKVHPLRETMMIMDISQAIDRCRARFDGCAPTMATNTKLWSMRAGRYLTVSEMAKLMGHDFSNVDLTATSETQMRMMLGMSMHVATAGYTLVGLLAAVGVSR